MPIVEDTLSDALWDWRCEVPRALGVVCLARTMGVDRDVANSPAGATVVLGVDHHARQPSDRGVGGNPFDYF